MPILLQSTCSHGKRITLPVEYVDLILYFAVKSLVWKILLMKIGFYLDGFVSYTLTLYVILLLTNQTLFLKIPHEMVMSEGAIVKQCHENL